MKCGFLELWGLEAKESFLSRQTPRIFKRKKNGLEVEAVRLAVRTHLSVVRKNVEAEIKFITDPSLSDRARGKRLLFLFQRDLLPGINGKILETKASRDREVEKEVSFTAKVCGWTYIVILNASMLFYIFLFALQQTSARQQAWLQSFLVWLAMEILLIGTVVVILTHVVIPSFTFTELKKIKNYLIQSFRKHRKKSKKGGTEVSNMNDVQEFNAASYLFVSYRLAKLYPDLLESKVILNFSTAWPVQTYNRQTDLTKNYKGSLKAIQSAVANIVVFLITNAIDLPPAIHDMTIGMISAVTMGYFVLIHVQLYQLYPVLVIIPSAIIGTLIHFAIKANKVRQRGDDDILPLMDDDKEDSDSLVAIKSIDTLQTLLVEKDKIEKRYRKDYRWSDSFDGESKFGIEVKSKAGSNQQDNHLMSYLVTNIERSDSLVSDFSLRTPPSLAEEDFLASSKGSSKFPSPSVSVDLDFADDVVSGRNSQITQQLHSTHLSEIENLSNNDNSKEDGNRWHDDVIECVNDSEADIYSMPSKTTGSEKSNLSFSFSLCSNEDIRLS